MIKNTYTYYYDRQLYKYILQFMSIFSVFQVKVGKRDEHEAELISVPIHYSSGDRVAASIIANNTQNTPIRLPAMAVYLKDIQMAPELRKGVGVERRNVMVPVGGLIPDDVQVIHQRQPVPYNVILEVAMFVSNIDQQLQLIEQIATLFDPSVILQVTDGIFDPARLTTVELTDIRLDDTTSQQDTRLIQNLLTFKVPVYLQLPANIRHDFVSKINMRIGIVNSGAISSEDILQQLDNEGFNYQTILDANNIPFK